MTEEQHGGQAFPSHPILHSSADQHHAQGMSLRDWIAGQALTGIINACAMDVRRNGESTEAMFARKAYSIADAMLKARETA